MPDPFYIYTDVIVIIIQKNNQKMSFKSPKYCLTYIYFALLTIIAVHFIM